MARLARVLEGDKLGKPLQRHPEFGDFHPILINVRPHAPGKVVVFNNAVPGGVRVDGRTLYAGQNAVVSLGSDLVVGEETFRVIA